MEIIYCFKTSEFGNELQWGHNFFVMEIRKLLRTVGEPYSFNGAITFSLWKSRRCLMELAIGGSFNGAITFSLWKFRTEYNMIIDILPSFNGAITFSLWKLAKWSAGNITTRSLQWGHNFFVMEISAILKKSQSPTELQWGHNFFVMEIAGQPQLKTTMDMLQWGHNFFVMEIENGFECKKCGNSASMGP